MTARVSLCVIARDEERMLPGCLASARGAVDELLVLDTGSRDRTTALAAAAGARVVPFAWCDDFAAARNAALAAAAGDWVLVLDADERLAPGAARAVREAVEDPGLDAGLLPLHDARAEEAVPEAVISGAARVGAPAWLPRLLRRVDGLAWRGLVHESVGAWLARRAERVRRVDAPIVHYGYVAALRAGRAKHARNAALLRARLARDPADVEAIGYLAGELYVAGDLEGAAATAERGWALVARGAWPEGASRLAVVRAFAALSAGAPERALESVARAEEGGIARPDGLFLRGAAAEALALRAPEGAAERAENAREAAARFGEALRREAEPGPERFVSDAAGAPLRVRLGEALLLAGEPRPARVAFEDALALDPASRAAALGAAEALLGAGDAAAALARVEGLLGEEPDGWAVAACAALALGARADAAALAREASRRAAAGFLSERRRQRAVALVRSLAR